ncbi:GNAT family N-acetyltransferase [Morganella morganii]|uniref:GNAT family N-acetyltransferase n=1 Tax=Morganella morganii TaxID=582 RepID=UPI001BD9BCFF|nr:GNAT family N-acetyltransferase [Morganella morganii]ELT0455230.1 GNAT family N-acetyltransferase [Morganella morganii]ELT0456080.1 GNAT family N-acetyltransferase [Morganella morganii]MBT0338623.1 GNAT family N-acetyltransferase [Morganella morganii subsp. morganii]
MITNDQTAGEISPATEQDLAALIALDSIAVQEPQRCEAIRLWIEQKICFVLRREGKIAGYGVLHYHFFGCGFIELLMVDPALRGQGVGSALLAALQQQCRTEKLFTSVNTSNTGMQALLLRQGFVLSGQVDNLDDGDPELFYFCRLSCRND